MIHLVMKRWKQRKWLTLLILLAFTAFFFLIPFNIQQVHKTELAVEQTLEKHGRGQFDLLVRPAGSRTEIEKSTQTVAENYIGDGQGGISLVEWERIKANPLVEIAAPVASIGYFSGESVSLNLPFPAEPTLYSWRYTTTDGIQTYPLPEAGNLMFFEDKGGELAVEPWYLVDKRYAEVKSFGRHLFLSVPENYYLLVGIDPESEEQLIGESFSRHFDNGISLAAEWTLKETGASLVKVVKRDGFQLPLSLELTMKPMDVKLEEFLEEKGITATDFYERYRQFFDLDVDRAMDKWLADQTFEATKHTIDLSNHLTPFKGTPFEIDENFNVQKTDKIGASLDTGIYYTANHIAYEERDGKLHVPQIGESVPPIYKEVEQQGASLDGEDAEGAYLIEEVATFSYDEPTSPSYVSSPLGIYSMQQSFTRDGKQVMPTIMPGSFVAPPASAVTDLASAELIKGDKPIDAIRIKVSGITGYNDEAKSRIDELTMDLLEQGYEVDVVAGSSFVQTTLDVEGIGEVIEPWTTLGVAQALQDSWNVSAIVLISLFVVFSLVWVSTRSIFEAHIYEKEKELLLNVGWSMRQVNRIRLLDQGLILAFACALSVVLLFTLNTDNVYMGYSGILGLVSLLVCGLAIIWPRKKSERQGFGKRAQSLKYYGHLFKPMMVMLTLTFVVMTMQLLVLAQTFITNEQTTLGTFLTEQTGSLQIGIIVVTAFLAAYSLSESLEAIFKERKNELVMYRAIGWSRKQIMRFYRRDLVIVFLVSVVIGIVIVAAIGFVLPYDVLWAVSSMGITMILLLIFIVGNLIRSMASLG